MASPDKIFTKEETALIAQLDVKEIKQFIQEEKGLIDAQIATAKQYPRNITACVNDCIATVTLSQEIAESCNYSVPKGGKPITGASVYLARIMVQNWGNMRAESRIIDIADRYVEAEGVCFDLQKNYAYRSITRRSIIGSSGRYNESMIMTTGNAAAAIAFRNATFNVIPALFVDKVYNASKEKVLGNVSDENALALVRQQIVMGLIEVYGVTEKEVLQYVGKNAIVTLTADDLMSLKGIGRSLKDGMITVDEAFRNKTSEQPPDRKDKESERLEMLIENAKTIKDLDALKSKLKTNEQRQAWDNKYRSLK